jgi:hypothetical protein
MPKDDIGLTIAPVTVTPKTPEVRRKVLARLDVMQRELQRVQASIGALRATLSLPTPSSPPIAHAVMNMRNWAISVAMSHSYVQMALSTWIDIQRYVDQADPATSEGQRRLPARALLSRDRDRKGEDGSRL